MSKYCIIDAFPGPYLATMKVNAEGIDEHVEAKERLETEIINGFKNMEEDVMKKTVFTMFERKKSEDVSNIVNDNIATIKKDFSLKDIKIAVLTTIEIEQEPSLQ